jgi:hypothetical protein
MSSLADTCDRSADRLCQAAGALAASDAPGRMLPALLPVLRWTQRLLTIAERRAAGMISILSAPQELPQSDSK